MVDVFIILLINKDLAWIQLLAVTRRGFARDHYIALVR